MEQMTNNSIISVYCCQGQQNTLTFSPRVTPETCYNLLQQADTSSQHQLHTHIRMLPVSNVKGLVLFPNTLLV